MITMYTCKKIIQLRFVENKSYREIVKDTGVAKNTVKKIIREYEAILANEDKDAAYEYLLHRKFQTPDREKTVLIPEVCKMIEAYVNDNQAKIATGLRKQCMNKKDMYRSLSEKGYDVSYPSVTKYARKYEQSIDKESVKSSECFIRQFHPAGEECEFDWGDVKLTIQGKRVTLRMAVFCMNHSNHRKAYLFLREDTVSLMEAHRNYFHDIGHIPHQMVYDNMRVAVRKFLGSTKVPTDALLRMSSFYGFKYRFCNVRSGNEKGQVEKSVDVVRGMAFAENQEFDSIEAAQKHLDAICDKLFLNPLSSATEDIQRLYQEDLDAMKPWTGDISCFMQKEYSIDKYSTFAHDGSRYSVPDSLVGKRVEVKVYSNKLEVLYEGHTVAAHQRLAVKGWKIDLDHYLKTLLRKPGAVRNSEALRQTPKEVQDMYTRYFAESPKGFIRLLIFARDKGLTYITLADMCMNLEASGVSDISEHMLMSLLSGDNQHESEGEVPVTRDEIERQSEASMSELTDRMNRLVV